jgi:hypothetical protein
MKHKWHKEIKAWADGAEIEIRVNTEKLGCDWTAVKPDPNWTQTEGVEYRIKPQPKEPQYLYVYYNSNECEFELEDRVLTNPYLRCIGKIKLEIE